MGLSGWGEKISRQTQDNHRPTVATHIHTQIKITLKNSMPTTATTATVPAFAKKRMKSPTLLMAITRRALATITMNAVLAALQNPYPWIAVHTHTRCYMPVLHGS